MNASAAALMIVALATGSIAGAQTCTVTDLGAAPGEQMSMGEGLNNKAQAVGTSSNANGEFGVATLFSGARAASGGSFGANDHTFATSTSDGGLVTGYIFDTGAGVSRVFRYSAGRMTDISDSALFPAGSDGTGINDSGQVCGYGWPNTATTHAFLYSGGVTPDLGTLGGAESVAEAIGSSGQVVGQSTNASGVTHAFLYQGGRMTDLGVPPGYSISSAIGISSNGLVVGELGVGSSVHTGVCGGGAWKDVGAGPLPTGINSSGTVIGWTTLPGVYSGPKSQRRAAEDIGVILINGSFVNLNTLIPAGSGFTINNTEAFNDSGQILCDALTPDGETHAVLLTP